MVREMSDATADVWRLGGKFLCCTRDYTGREERPGRSKEAEKGGSEGWREIESRFVCGRRGMEKQVRGSMNRDDKKWDNCMNERDVTKWCRKGMKL